MRIRGETGGGKRRAEVKLQCEGQELRIEFKSEEILAPLKRGPRWAYKLDYGLDQIITPLRG